MIMMNEWKVVKIKKIFDTEFEMEDLEGHKYRCAILERDGLTVGLLALNKDNIESILNMEITDRDAHVFLREAAAYFNDACPWYEIWNMVMAYGRPLFQGAEDETVESS